MSLRKSKITCVLDVFLYLLFFGITAVSTYFLWTRVHWLLAIIMAFPIYRVIGYPIIFLTTPLFNWLTPENRAWSLWCRLAFRQEWDERDDRASRLSEAIEKWDAGGDCADLRECCERIRSERSASLSDDSSETTVEARKD